MSDKPYIPDTYLAKLSTEDGDCYVNLSGIVLIGPVVIKDDKAPARRIGFGSNVYQFVTNTPSNLRALGLTDEADALQVRWDIRLREEAEERAAKPKRTRTRKAKP